VVFVKITVQSAPTTLPGPNLKSQRNMANNNWDDLTNDLRSHHYPATPNSSRRSLNTDSELLEHHLESALSILIQTSGILADGVTPQARNTLIAINAVISMEIPSYNPSPFKSVRKVIKNTGFNRYYLILCLTLSFLVCITFTFIFTGDVGYLMDS
jgi:hypothetical protein